MRKCKEANILWSRRCFSVVINACVLIHFSLIRLFVTL